LNESNLEEGSLEKENHNFLGKLPANMRTDTREGNTTESNTADKASENLSYKIGEYIRFSNGNFDVPHIYRDFNLATEKDRTNARVILHRYAKEGLIEPDPKVNGRFRRIKKELELMNWDKPLITPYDVALPFGLEKYANLYEKNIVIIAGNKGSGKTTALLNFAFDNADKHKIYYAVSDMGEEELGVRIGLFEEEYGAEARETFRKVTFCYQDRHYSDIIRPNDINIIDYLEVVENFAEVGRPIFDIHNKLDKGLAIIALQKSKHKDLGRGGDFSLEKARLYLSLTHDFYDPDGNTCKIVSVKSYASPVNPHGLIQKFKIVKGTKIIPAGVWHHEEDEKLAAESRGKKW